MELALILSTGSAVLAAGVAIFAAFRAVTSEDRASHAANRLLQSQGQLRALTGSVDALDTRLTRLNGRVNAELHRRKHGAVADDFDDPPPRQPALNGHTDDFDIDPAVAAELALQRGPNARPGG